MCLEGVLKSQSDAWVRAACRAVEIHDKCRLTGRVEPKLCNAGLAS